MNTVEMRTAYGEALVRLGAADKRVVVLEADVGSSSKSALFGRRFPERYYNVGISELDMNAMAAGFASCGLIPFTNTFSVFMTLRGGDPINSLICYDNLNVKLCGAYCGLSDSYDGASHHGTADLAMLRALPNMTILSPCDGKETERAVFAAAERQGPVYLRISRAPVPTAIKGNEAFQIGKGVILREGKDVTLFACGSMVEKALQAAELLHGEGVLARVVNLHTIAPMDTGLVLDCAGETGAFVTAEEHSVYGGLGSAVAEAAVAEAAVAGRPVPMEMVGLTGYAESGDYAQLLEKYGLTPQNIAAKAHASIRRKR